MTTILPMLIENVDLKPDLDRTRSEVARLILDTLEAKRDSLTSWEKLNFEMAIALLPTVWIKLCLAHISMALSPETKLPIDPERIDQLAGVSAAILIERVRRLGYQPLD